MPSKKFTFLLCSNYAWTIYNFRMPLIRRLKSQGHDVVVFTQFDGYETIISNEVDQITPLFISRKGINPFIDLFTIVDFIRILYSIKPDFLLLFTIKPVIYGCIAARLTNVKIISMITGLGTAFNMDNLLTKLVKKLYKFSLKTVSIVFFQNIADKDIFVNNKLVDPDRCRLIPGSGVDTRRFHLSELPKKDEMTFLLIARMLWDKGIGEFVEAARVIKLVNPKVRFQLLGPLGVDNRTAIPMSKIVEWEEEQVIEYMGDTDDVTTYIEQACCIVLPSYREGTSRVLLEAAAMGRPIIATDVPGCREVVTDGDTGLLCEPKDYLSLSQKMKIMLELSYKTRETMGAKGRDKICSEFNQDIVCNLYLDAINATVS